MYNAVLLVKVCLRGVVNGLYGVLVMYTVTLSTKLLYNLMQFLLMFQLLLVIAFTALNWTKMVGNGEISKVFTRLAVICSKMLKHSVKHVQFAWLSDRFSSRSILISVLKICRVVACNLQGQSPLPNSGFDFRTFFY